MLNGSIPRVGYGQDTAFLGRPIATRWSGPRRLHARLNLITADPLRAAFEDAIEAFGDTAVPWLAEIAGFRGALLFADRCPGI